MSIQITFTFETEVEAAAFLLRGTPITISGATEPRPFEREHVQVVTPAEQATPGVPQPPEVPAKKPRAKKAPAAPSPIEDVLTTDDLRAALKTLLADNGADACQNILAKYSVDRISEVPPGKYADFVASCKAETTL